MSKPIIDAETEIGKKKTRAAKEIPYDDLKDAALKLSIKERVALCQTLKTSVIDEASKRQAEAKEVLDWADQLK